jgi:hypothetical protein
MMPVAGISGSQKGWRGHERNERKKMPVAGISGSQKGWRGHERNERN